MSASETSRAPRHTAVTQPARTPGKADAATVRFQNERLLLNHIWSSRELSRAHIARITGLSRSTVSAIVNALIDTGLVRFLRAGISSGGRRPILLGFEDDAQLLVGVDIGATHISVAVTNLRCTIRSWQHARHAVRDDPSGALGLVEHLVRAGLDEAGRGIGEVAGVGVAVPCPIDPARPEVLSPLVLPAWGEVDLVGHLGDAFGLPVFIDNDANLGALAELWWGAGTDLRDLAYIKIGTGVGAGLIHGGAIYRGAAGIAGEIGHLVVEPDGLECLCGLRGCLGTVASSAALKARVVASLDAGRDSVLTRDLDTDALVDAVLAGDALAAEVVAAAGRRLGTAIASLINLVNPATVVLGGGLTRAGELLLGPLREAMQHRAMLKSLDETRLVTSGLHHRGVALGAATQVLAAALDDPRLFNGAEAPGQRARG